MRLSKVSSTLFHNHNLIFSTAVKLFIAIKREGTTFIRYKQFRCKLQKKLFGQLYYKLKEIDQEIFFVPII